MPIYEYRCDACRQEFEVIQKITADPLETCKLCGAPNPSKLISNSSFVLKGSGWYLTDYVRKENGGKQEGKGGASKSGDTACASGCAAAGGSCAGE